LAVGAHLVQKDVQGVEQTVMFVSKKLNDVQQRWSTTDQEMFAIYYSILKLKYILGGRSFIVRSDHNNLRYWFSDSASPKVERWRQALLEFDFRIEFIAGVNNCVADVLSRLCLGGSEPLYPPEFEELELPLPSAVLSADQITEVIAAFHNERQGHHGIQRTIKMLHKQDIGFPIGSN
jgi:hypothetical protein